MTPTYRAAYNIFRPRLRKLKRPHEAQSIHICNLHLPSYSLTEWKNLQERLSELADTSFMVQNPYFTAQANSMTLDKLTVYYPDHLFNGNAQRLTRLDGIPGMKTRKQIATELKEFYHLDCQLDKQAISYYLKSNPNLPASIPINLLSALKQS
ncbi:hypothetical protein P389DRAFT_62820 [Cystobasidium minutum MCA 4210]|uniref:uncharacterized protein n=1 Tax=Cystobasidium minutum MCA 4210 TaxID=1397322 RepID=UPI0034CD1BB8|eukprot:jgi/Rhomi1/62820/CE62819_1787